MESLPFAQKTEVEAQWSASHPQVASAFNIASFKTRNIRKTRRPRIINMMEWLVSLSPVSVYLQ